MAGFSPVDPGRCEHYAAFASHLDRRAFDIIYWVLFVFVIFMLFLASWKYSGSVRLATPNRLSPSPITDAPIAISRPSLAWSPAPANTETG